MSNQIRGTTTNMTKLVAWDIDLYQSMDTEENCLIWLSQQDKYLLGNALRQMKWSTRWTSEQGTPQPDRDLIAENLAYKLSQEYCVDICQLIIDCINDTDEIQRLISQYSLTSSIEDTTPQQQSILGTDLFSNQAPCNNDQIFGMTLQLADFLNATSEDILEIFVTAFAVPGRLGDLIESIPVVGELPFDDILQMIEKLAIQVNDAYQAAYDTQIREDIACDLFCIAQADCTLTLEQARDYFKDKMTVAVTDSNFASIANDIIANNWLGEQSIYVMHWLILDTIIFGGEVLGVDVNRMVTTIATYFNDPDSDWQLLCTACATTVIVTFDTNGYQNYSLSAGTIDNSFGNPQPSNLSDEQAGGNAIALTRVDLQTTSETVTAANFDSYSSTGTYSAFIRFRDVNDVVLSTQTWTLRPQNQWNNVAWSGSIANVAYVEFFAARTRAIVDIIHIDNLSTTF